MKYCVVILLLISLVTGQKTTNNEKFVFTKQPTDAQLEQGNTHRMFCTVDTNVPVKYTWYKSDRFLKLNTITDDTLTPMEGQQSSVLFFSSINKLDAGYYHCTVHSDKFKIYSNTARLKVTYFNVFSLVQKRKTIQENVPKSFIECNTPDSEPLTEIKWYKDTEEISDDRMFIFPGDNGGVKRGTLMIINAQKKDQGIYRCKTTYKNEVKELSEITVTTSAGVSPPYKKPTIDYISKTELNVEAGGTITMICAGSGYPAPSIEWTFNEARVSTADSVFIQNYNKRLIVSNVKEEGIYNCKLSNSRKITNDRKHAFYVAIVEKSSNIIDIVKKPESQLLYPNRYVPFTLNCSVRDTDITMLWLKDGKPRDFNYRINVDDSSTVENGVPIRNMNLIFETPNESDLGVYQCILYNNEELREETAYITLQVEQSQYERADLPQYQFVSDPKTVDLAEEHCKDVFQDGAGHLVSIMNRDENSIVRNLMIQNEVETVWIGLTREDPNPEGFWKWTQPGDLSTVYSNWRDEKPDNLYSKQEYAVMRKYADNTAMWEDVSNEVKHPFVCKRYKTTCQSVDSFYKGRVSVRGWEMSDTQYEVGESLEVYCTDMTVKVNVNEITCSSTGEFVPAKIDCPKISAAYIHCSSLIFSVISLMFVSLLTYS